MNLLPTVFIVEDEEKLRTSMTQLIENADFNVESFDTSEKFLLSVPPNRPGCLLLDVRLPEMSGLELQDKLIARGYGIPIIFITGHGDVRMCLQAVKKGAFHFFEKPFIPKEMIEIIRHAIEFDQKNRISEEQKNRCEDLFSTLTSSEQEVLSLIIDGKPNKTIAAILDVSIRTVEYRKKSILDKLNVNSIAGLIKLALKANVV